MIKLTRLRQNTPFILNPDHIERVDTHVDTVVRLTSGAEYLVNESGDEIVRRTAEFRARVIAIAGTLDAWAESNALADGTPAPTPTPAPEPEPEPEPVATEPDPEVAAEATDSEQEVAS